jgi:hypothetical protein
MRRCLVLVSVVALLIAGVAGAGGAAGVGGTTGGEATTSASTPATDATTPATDATTPATTASTTGASPTACTPETDTDVVGCWDGVAHDETFTFNQSDGLTPSQLEALTHRSMARVEYVRERPFQTDVPVETMTREEFRANGTGGTSNESADDRRAFDRWNDQVWEALFVVGENESSAEAIDTVFGGSVSGFYSPADDRIVLVVPAGSAVQIDESTLVHELTHGMQDQYHDLTRSQYVGTTQDADLAVDGLVEGEAVYIEERYTERCGDEWQCLSASESDGSGGGLGSINVGILQTILQPYVDGPFYVERLVETGGWEAVDAAMADPPSSTAAVIHREPVYEPRDVAFEDTARGDWTTYPDQGVDGAETAGEASMFVMFWYQSFAGPEAPVLDPADDARGNVRLHLRSSETLQTRTAYTYDHPVTAGWAGDELYPYRNDAGDAEQDGYVWVTAWQTPEDAAEFEAAYHRLLDAHGATAAPNGTQVVSTGGFRGAYGVERDGARVTIVHGPDVDDVFDLRPDLRPEAEPPAESVGTDADGDDATTGTSESVERDRDTSEGASTSADTTSETGEDTTAGAAPGLGVVVTVLALVAVAALLARRSRR